MSNFYSFGARFNIDLRILRCHWFLCRYCSRCCNKIILINDRYLFDIFEQLLIIILWQRATPWRNYPINTQQFTSQNQQKLTIRIFHGFEQGQENQSEGQGFSVQDEASRVVDVAFLWREGGFPCPWTKAWVIFFSPTAFNPVTKTPVLFSKSTSKHFLLRKWRQLGLIMWPSQCMIYDVKGCSVKRSCLYRGW